MTESTIEEVTTEDATPNVAPFVVSNKEGHTTALVRWVVASAGRIKAWRMRINPVNRNSGLLVAKKGMVCGSGDRCGPDARSLDVAAPLELETPVDSSILTALSEPDGDYTVEVYGMSAEEGWG